MPISSSGPLGYLKVGDCRMAAEVEEVFAKAEKARSPALSSCDGGEAVLDRHPASQVGSSLPCALCAS